MRTSLLLSALLLVAACATPVKPEPVRIYEPATRLPDGGGLKNVARLTPELYRGAQPTEDGYRKLKQLGIKTVVSFRCFTDTRPEVEAAGLDYVMIPIYASIGSNPPTDAQLQTFFDTVLDPSKQPVYIHCKHGKDRTGMMAALFRIERQLWTIKEATDEMQDFGYHDIFRDLIAFVRTYARRGYEAPPEAVTDDDAAL